MSLLFEWDDEKAKRNLKKHGVDFEEAKTVFADPFSITIPDCGHSQEEDRFIDIGLSAKGNTLVVIYTEREENIRIISSRMATRSERRTYEEGIF